MEPDRNIKSLRYLFDGDWAAMLDRAIKIPFFSIIVTTLCLIFLDPYLSSFSELHALSKVKAFLCERMKQFYDTDALNKIDGSSVPALSHLQSAH